MAFLDGVGKKISQTGQSAVQKTKEMADVAKMNTAISEEERRLNSSYTDLGRLYAAAHASDYEEDFADAMSAIRESENKIHEYRQQIQNIKGIVRCEKCGAEIANDSAFCSTCGASVPKREIVVNDANQIQCIGCGRMVSREIKFCTACGKAVAESMQARMPSQEAGRASAEAANKKICPNCSAVIDEDSKFCTVCGKAVVENIQARTPSQDAERTSVETAGAAAKRICPNCGAEIEDDSRFCILCGQAISDCQA